MRPRARTRCAAMRRRCGTLKSSGKATSQRHRTAWPGTWPRMRRPWPPAPFATGWPPLPPGTATTALSTRPGRRWCARCSKASRPCTRARSSKPRRCRFGGWSSSMTGWLPRSRRRMPGATERRRCAINATERWCCSDSGGASVAMNCCVWTWPISRWCRDRG